MAHEHDIRYKKLFSNPVLLQELLQCFVDEEFISELNFSTLERLDKSFITDEFREKESDRIYKINIRKRPVYIYLLLEFQSTVDKFMSLRMLRYICEFYEFLVQKKVKKLPPVFPVLLYNGEGKWTAKKNINDLIDKSIPDKYIPDFEYYTILEYEFSKETLLTIKNAVSAIFFVENSEPEKITYEIKKIIKLLETEKPEIIILFGKWLQNIIGVTEPAIKESIKSLEDVREMFSAKLKKYGKKLLQEGIEKGVKKGVKKGVEEGIIQGEKKKAIETARKMLFLEYTVDNISAVTGLSRQEIEKLKE